MQMKKIMAAVTAMLMAGSLAACSDSDGNGDTTTAPAAGGDTTAADGGSADAGNTAGDGSISGCRNSHALCCRLGSRFALC